VCHFHICFFFILYLNFKSTYQQTTYQNRGSHFNVITFHNIINVFFQDERKHEQTSFLLFISIRRVQKYLSINHISKQRKPLGYDYYTFQKSFIIFWKYLLVHKWKNILLYTILEIYFLKMRTT